MIKNFLVLIIIVVIFSKFGVAEAAVAGINPILNFKIELNVQLPNKIDYTLQVSNLKPNFNYEFELNSGLKIESLSPDDKLSLQGSSGSNKYLLNHKNDTAAAFKITGNLISDFAIGPTAMVLNSNSNWFPQFNELMTYEVIVKSDVDTVVFNPAKISEKCGTQCFHFLENRPQEDIHIIFGKYIEYKKILSTQKTIGVLLLAKDDALAQQYLDILPEFIQRYENQIGTYPYDMFYVVENFNETGFGMPGFTLLGSSVMRLPFIFRTSLPHEVLHNWWGNGVFVDAQRGNWCEGLTTYGADHFEQELLGTDANYRRGHLLAYSDFVKTEKEFPLVQFKNRVNESSQAIGYSKSMMFFHMLKKWVGDEVFQKGLQTIYSTFQFHEISFDEIVNSFSSLTKTDLSEFAQPWIKETGVVDLKVSKSCESNENIAVKIQSTPKNFQYVLPYQIQSAEGSQNNKLIIKDGQAKIFLPKDFSGSIQFDPKFDVFRKLSQGEKPLSISRFLSSDKIYMIIEKGLEIEADSWIQGIRQVFSGEIIKVSTLDSAPENTLVIFYGFKDYSVSKYLLKFLTPDKIDIKDKQIIVEGKPISVTGRGWILMSYDNQKNQVLTWALKPDENTAEAWGKQLTHYSKFGILIFNGKRNEVKTSWAEGKSDLTLEILPCPK